MSYGDGIGFKSEELVQELLEVGGWHVVNTRKAADKGRAPLSQAEDRNLRLPDFLVHHEDHPSRYVEVKAKTKPIKYGIENSWRHGWERPKHDDYLEMDQLSDVPVIIVVHEQKSGVVLRKRVRELSIVQEITDSDQLQKYDTTENMVLFKREQFDTVTDDISSLSAGYGQSGLIADDAEISPFGLTPDGEQSGLTEFDGGDGDE